MTNENLRPALSTLERLGRELEWLERNTVAAGGEGGAVAESWRNIWSDLARIADLLRAAGAVLVLVLLAGGCERVPMPLNEEVAAPEGADDAAAIAVAEWSMRLPARLSADYLPQVRWFEGPCLIYDEGGPAGCADGYYGWVPYDAAIDVVLKVPLHESALAHEILHWGLDDIYGDADGAHESPLWRAEPDVTAVLAEAGL